MATTKKVGWPAKTFQTKALEIKPKVTPKSKEELVEENRRKMIEMCKKQLEKNPWTDKMYYGFSYDGKVEECTYVRLR